MSVSRKELQELLLNWQNGTLKPLEVLEWAEDRYDLDPLQGELVIEIMTLLDSMNASWITIDDVPIFLAALSSPVESENESLAMIERYFENIDFETRRPLFQ